MSEKDLKDLLNTYNLSNQENKYELQQRITINLKEVFEDYKVDKEELENHYKQYNNIIQEINSTLGTHYNTF